MTSLDVHMGWFLWNPQRLTEDLTGNIAAHQGTFPHSVTLVGLARSLPIAKNNAPVTGQNVSKLEGVFQKWLFTSMFFQQFSQLLIKLIVNTFSKGCVCVCARACMCVLVFGYNLFCVIELCYPGKCSAVNAILYKHELGSWYMALQITLNCSFVSFCCLFATEQVSVNKYCREGHRVVRERASLPGGRPLHTSMSSTFSH